jgi:DNA-binding MarR family transcriptional regulator
MLSKDELRVIEALDGPKTRQDLAAELDYAPSTVTNAVSHLASLNLVLRDTSTGEVLVTLSEARSLEVYQSLTKAHPHVDFPDLLTKSAFRVFYYLSAKEWTIAATLIDRSNLSKATVYRIIDRFTNRAMIVKDHSRYRLDEDFAELHIFATELRHHIHRNRMRHDLESGTILWETYDTFLVRVDTQISSDNYHLTGLDAFAEYGLEFFTTSEFYYFYSEDLNTLAPADLVCQLLLIEDDARHRKYALVLVAATQTDSDEVRKRANYYGLDTQIDAMMTYLETNGDKTTDWLPPWEEFESLARDYEVKL